MKPLPPELQAAYPCPSDRLPDRPWWQKGVWPVNDADYVDLRPSRFRRQDGRLAVFLEEVAAIDASDPLPHPGFRVGQVWGWPDGTAIAVTASANQNKERFWILGFPDGHLGSLEICQDVERPVVPIGPGWRQVGMSERFYGRFLLADPACPHLAPWAPV